MRAFPLAALGLALFVCCDSAAAQVRKFPYRATVESEVYVRSGPGKRFYATAKLQSGAEVMVHRHDPGGWYMIAPPPGSFSWIREEYVDFQGGNTGVVRENNVVVRVGSEYGDVRDVEQRRLSKGDRVQVVGRETVRDEFGEQTLLKIRPPAGEYRWVSGRSVMPVDRGDQIARSRDPYATPAGLGSRIPEEMSPVVPEPELVEDEDPLGGFEERPLVRVRKGDAIADNRSDPAALARDQRTLREIDLAFKSMIEQDPTTWDLDGLRRRYRDLERTSSQPSITGAIPARLAAVSRYQKVEKDYVEFVTLTRSTTEKDAELVSKQRSLRPSRQPAGATSPGPAPTLSGAGLVERNASPSAGGPTHVLLHPNGRILAYLRAGGDVDFDSWLGRQVGLVGQRSFDGTLQGDVIDVERILPVRLSR